MDEGANKALHWTPISLRSIGASELGRWALITEIYQRIGGMR